jgi:hypothetical protein
MRWLALVTFTGCGVVLTGNATDDWHELGAHTDVDCGACEQTSAETFRCTPIADPGSCVTNALHDGRIAALSVPRDGFEFRVIYTFDHAVIMFHAADDPSTGEPLYESRCTGLDTTTFPGWWAVGCQ